MSNKRNLCARNQSMEVAKFIASAFVVFIHVHFPGNVGDLIDYAGSFAVPMFFAITGYFNFQADSRKAMKRTKHIVKLYLLGVGTYLLWIAVSTACGHGTVMDFVLRVLPDQVGLTKWLVLQSEFLVGHLWYLHALIVVYLLYWAYLRFYEGIEAPRQPLYFAGFVLFAIMFVVGVIIPLYDNAFPGVCRNAYLMGIPMFIMGIFFHEYQDQIVSRFRLTPAKLVGLVILGELLTVQQWIRCGVGTPMGTLIASAALILLLALTPQLVSQGSVWEKVVMKCGACSTWIYLFHLTVEEIYVAFFQNGISQILREEVEIWIHPVLIFVVSALLGMVIDMISNMLSKRAQKVLRA